MLQQAAVQIAFCCDINASQGSKSVYAENVKAHYLIPHILWIRLYYTENSSSINPYVRSFYNPKQRKKIKSCRISNNNSTMRQVGCFKTLTSTRWDIKNKKKCRNIKLRGKPAITTNYGTICLSTVVAWLRTQCLGCWHRCKWETWSSSNVLTYLLLNIFPICRELSFDLMICQDIKKIKYIRLLFNRMIIYEKWLM